MSLLLLIDGYNVVAPVAPPGRASNPTWLQRERNLLLQRLAKHLGEKLRRRTCVVFDAANPPRDRPSEFDFEGIDVRFAVGYPEADDLLESIIANHSAPKTLAVVSSDHRVQAAARRRGSKPYDSQPWLDDLIDGRIGLAASPASGAGQGSEPTRDKPEAVNDNDVQQWMDEFGL